MLHNGKMARFYPSHLLLIKFDQKIKNCILDVANLGLPSKFCVPYGKVSYFEFFKNKFKSIKYNFVTYSHSPKSINSMSLKIITIS